jgi:hypothetical protein
MVSNQSGFILKQWRNREIPIWEEENKAEERRADLILRAALQGISPVQLFAPVCPDYPVGSNAPLGVGVGDTVPPVMHLMSKICSLFEGQGVLYYFTVLLADTEVDMPEIVDLLANSEEDFLDRCHKSISAICDIWPDINQEVCSRRVITFLDFFGENWYRMQYFWENVIRKKFEEGGSFHQFLNQVAGQRTTKYEAQLRRSLRHEEKVNMAVRHYAQYHAVGYWMRQHPGAIMINTNSPNLRAIRRPFVVPKGPVVEVPDQNQRIPIIVLK